jgi:hypothetical protein
VPELRTLALSRHLSAPQSLRRLPGARLRNRPRPAARPGPWNSPHSPRSGTSERPVHLGEANVELAKTEVATHPSGTAVAS